MREILFRGKRIDDGVWVYGSYTAMREDDHNECFRTKPHKIYHRIWQWEAGDWNMGGYANYEVIPETVGQYTGLSDKNGKKIFEGDILLSRYEDKVEDSGYGSIYNEVAFTNGSFGMIGENTGDIIPFSEYPVTEEVVVGNIYDNPSLIQ